jgi:hypothetical protein
VAYVLHEQAPPVLLLRTPVILGLDPNEEPPLEIYEVVEVQEEVVDDVLGHDLLPLQRAHVVLQVFEVLNVLALRVDHFLHNPVPAVHRFLGLLSFASLRVPSVKQQVPCF